MDKLINFPFLFKKILIGLSYLIIYELTSISTNLIAGAEFGPKTVETLFFPPTAITMAFLLYFGAWMIPLIPIDIFIDAYTRGRPEFVYLFLPLIITIGYGLTAIILKKIVKFDTRLKSLKDGSFFLVITAGGAILVSFSYSLVRYVFLPKATPDFFNFAFNWFIGDIVAIYAITPFLIVIIFPFLEKFISLIYRYMYQTFNGTQYEETGKKSAELFDESFTYKKLVNYSKIFLISLVISASSTIIIFYQKSFVPTQVLVILFIPLTIIALMYGIKGSILINNLIIFEVLILLKFVQNQDFFEFQIIIFSLSSVALILGTVITERKSYQNIIEDKIQERTFQLEDANKDLQFFSYSVSHDLQAPLHISQQILASLLEQYNEQLIPEVKNELLSLENQNKNMKSLIEDLLEFFKLNEQEIVKQDVDMREVINSAFNSVKKEFSQRSINLQFNTNIPKIICDESLLFIVWSNLLSNAIKYSSKSNQSIIEIGFEANKGGRDLFYIKDNGIGFDMKDEPKIFNVFQRIHPEYEGTGLGLPLVKRIISKHGGNIWAKSEINKGATFYFTL